MITHNATGNLPRTEPKLRIDAEGMREIQSLTTEILTIMQNRIPDIAIDQCQNDILENEDAALSEELDLEGIIASMVIAEIRREF